VKYKHVLNSTVSEAAFAVSPTIYPANQPGHTVGAAEAAEAYYHTLFM